MPKKVVVVGGGIAGLAVSHEILRRGQATSGGVEVLCLEGSPHTGGNIRTLHEDGFVCEWGPNGFLDNVPATLDLARRVGLGDALLPADEQSEIRYIFRKGALRKVPSGPGSFLRSDVLSLSGKLRVLAEPLARKRPADRDESVFEFAARRIGPEAARVLVGAMVTGVYAGDAAALCLRSTFPKMYDMETEHGGLFRAMIAKAREARASGEKHGGPAGPGGRLTSFRDGLQEFPDAVARSLGDVLQLNTPVNTVGDMGRRGFRLLLEHGSPLDADAVVLACPAWDAAKLVADMDADLAAKMNAIPSASLAVVHLGYEEKALQSRPEGFGFLVPRGEGPHLLGALWSSNIFPGRAPDGKFLMTVMVGGAHEPEILELDDKRIVESIRRELETTMGVLAAPRFVRVFRHPRGIPQYTVGHQDRLAAIDARLGEHPGLFVHGNSFRGISVNLCVEQAPAVADAVLKHLGGAPVQV
jgi:oxygen-dependent protoporphyrinogen oxidase